VRQNTRWAVSLEDGKSTDTYLRKGEGAAKKGGEMLATRKLLLLFKKGTPRGEGEGTT